MTTSAGQDRGCSEPQLYEIRLQGHFDPRWADRFEGLTFTFESDGVTSLTGPLADQSALHGVLMRIRDLGLPIVSIRRVPPTTHSNQEEGQS
jgi:hypothetical protein